MLTVSVNLSDLCIKFVLSRVANDIGVHRLSADCGRPDFTATIVRGWRSIASTS